MTEIGRMYFEGWGVPRGFHKALECLFLAASYGIRKRNSILDCFTLRNWAQALTLVEL